MPDHRDGAPEEVDVAHLQPLGFPDAEAGERAHVQKGPAPPIGRVQERMHLFRRRDLHRDRGSTEAGQLHAVGQVASDPLMSEFRRHLIARRRSPKTVRVRMQYVSQFRLSHPEMLKVTRREIHAYFDEKAAGWSVETMNVAVSSVRAFYKWAVMVELFAADPTMHLQGATVPRTEARIASDETVSAALAGATTKQRAGTGGARMTWSKISDDFGDDCWTLSDQAVRLHLEGIVWSNRKLLVLKIPKAEVRRFAKPPDALPELLENGFWRERPDHHEIVHHAKYQRSKSNVFPDRDRGRRAALPRRSCLRCGVLLDARVRIVPVHKCVHFER